MKFNISGADTSKNEWSDYSINIDGVLNTIHKKDPEVTLEDLSIIGGDEYGLPLLRSKKDGRLYKFFLCREKDMEKVERQILTGDDEKEIASLMGKLGKAEEEVLRIKRLLQEKEDSLYNKNEL